MKILITGANGYIGKSLFNALKDKYDITAITRQDFDLTNVQSMIKFFENKYFYPYGWDELSRRFENFSVTCPDAYSVHHWAHSWW